MSNYTEPLNRFGKVHYARFVLIPNSAAPGKTLAICVITSFDGPMNPYLTDFWNDPDLQKVFAGLATMALAETSVTNYTEFQRFINDNNLSGMDELYQAYKHTVLQIKAAVKDPA